MQYLPPATADSRPRGWSSTLLARGLTQAQGRLAALLVTVVFAVCALLWGEPYWDPVRQAVFDAYQRAWPRQGTQWPVIIVDIDDASLAALGQWPWPRARLARLIDLVVRQEVLAVGLDLIMPEPDRLSPGVFLAERSDVSPAVQEELAKLPSNDALLADTLRRSPSVVGRAAIPDGAMHPITHQTPVLLQGEIQNSHLQAYSGHLTNLPILEEAAAGHGYLNDTRDADGIVRTLPLLMTVGGQVAPSLALELLRVALGQRYYRLLGGAHGVRGIQLGDRIIPLAPDGRIRVYFAVPGALRRVSALTLLQGEALDVLRGKIAIIGVTGIGLSDVVTTPLTRRMDGVEVHAQVIENINEGLSLKRPLMGLYLEVAAFLVVAIVLMTLLPHLGPLWGLGIQLGSTMVYLGVSLLAFVHAQWLVDASLPSMGNGLVLGTLLAAGLAVADRRRRDMRALLEAERLQRLHIVAELNTARKIQMGMLPAPGSIVGLPGHIGFHAILEPAEEIGGDLYDAFMVDEQHFFFLVGDVAGNGVPAALFMALSKTLCKSVALRDRSPLEALMTAINGEISRDNPEALFVTAMVGILDVRTGDLVLCSAGHEAPILLRRGEPARSLETAGGPPFCVIDNFPYDANRLLLQAGDLLVCITDGVTEAHDVEQNLYGHERVLASCTALHHGHHLANAAAVCQGLYDDVKRFRRDAAPSDDITIMAIHFHTPESSGPMV